MDYNFTERNRRTVMMSIQSNGMGQQSAALYFMSSLGIIPRFDYSVFADPGREKKETYDYIRYMMHWQRINNGIPIIWTGNKSLFRDIMNGQNSYGKQGWISIPAYTSNDDGSIGILRRQCTEEYKIKAFNKIVRKLTGKPKGKYPPVRIYNAITIEELDRVSAPEIAEFINVYPFCNLEITKSGTKFLDFEKHTRASCVTWLIKNGFRVPPKSACTFCPYQSDAQWLDTKINDPKEWKALVKLDDKFRNSTAKGVKNPVYLHRSAKPLREVDLKEDQTSINFDCSGNCDI